MGSGSGGRVPVKQGLRDPAQSAAIVREQLGVDVVDLGGVSNSRSAAKFGRTRLGTPGRLWDSQLGRACDVLGVDRASGFLWLRYSLSPPLRAIEVGLEVSSLSHGRWEPL